MPMHRDILLLTGCMCLAQVNVSSTIAPTINLDSDSCFTVLLHRAEGLGNSARIVANSAKIPFRESPIAESPIAKSPIAESPIAESPIAKSPIAKSPVAESPITKSPIAESPIAESPIAESPIADFCEHS